MPSIPQSLLWISLVVLWLFVLVPMLISKRDAVRRTSDVALATRVLNGGPSARLLRRGGPAAGHASDPDWRPSEEDLDDDLDEQVDDEPPGRSVVRAAAVDIEEDTEPDHLDLDVEDSGESANEPVEEPEEPEHQTDELPLDFDEPAAEEQEPEYEPEPDGSDDEYEYVADSSGIEAPSD
ncbi:MAG TPA: gephyrin-like molybdotransferase receptor GlpR, partial [Mycobacterium sp.]|nr:gephyrin-like molybdotransferase receptor GlpR [Mycobacterium sp.]